MADKDGCIGWDDEVVEPEKENEELVVLDPGEYVFKVHKVERGSFSGSQKLPPCNMVKVGVFIIGENGNGYATERFFMHTKTLFKIYQFLISIGLHKKGSGSSGPIPWGKVVPGMTGLCKVKLHEYDGKTSNEIEKWLEPAPESTGGDTPGDEEY